MIKQIIVSIFFIALTIFAMRFLRDCLFNSTPVAKLSRASNPIKGLWRLIRLLLLALNKAVSLQDDPRYHYSESFYGKGK